MKNIWRMILFMAGTILLALTLAPYGTGIFRFLELPSGFRPLLMLLGGIHWMFALLLWRDIDRHVQNHLINAFGISVVAVNLIEVAPWYTPKIRPTNSKNPIEILVYNVTASNQNYDKAITYAQQEGADVAIFLESAGEWPHNLTRLKEDFPYHLPVQVAEFDIYSKHPILHHELHFFGDYRGFIECTINIDGIPYTVVAYHAYAGFYLGKRGFELRNEQLQRLTKMYRDTRERLIVMGSFNIDPWSPIYKRAMKDSGLFDARKTFGPSPSCALTPRAYQFPWLARPIDTAIVSESVQVQEFRTGPFLGSKHLPLTVEILREAE